MKNDNRLPKVMNEILFVTLQMRLIFPAQYQLLGETPLVIADTERKINTNDFEIYLESLKNQLKNFLNRQPQTR